MEETTILKELIGKTFDKVYIEDDSLFLENKKEKYVLFQDTSCCDEGYLEDVCGDLENLIGNQLTIAEEFVGDSGGKEDPDYIDEDHYVLYYTFYKFATIKGYVTIRWMYTAINSSYSEQVTFAKFDGEGYYDIIQIANSEIKD